MTDTDSVVLAGWDPSDGEAPFTHAAPPPDNPALGNNGIPPTDAAQTS